MVAESFELSGQTTEVRFPGLLVVNRHHSRYGRGRQRCVESKLRELKQAPVCRVDTSNRQHPRLAFPIRNGNVSAKAEADNDSSLF